MEVVVSTQRWELVAPLFYKGYLEQPREAQEMPVCRVPEVLRWTLHVADGTFHYCLKGSRMYSTMICFTYQGGETGNQDSLRVSQRSPSLKSAVRLPQYGKIGHQCLFKMRTREPDR